MIRWLRNRKHRRMALDALIYYLDQWIWYCEGDPMPSEIEGKNLATAAILAKQGKDIPPDLLELLRKWSRQ